MKAAPRLPSLNIDYLCLDYGIAAFGSKGASVHMRSICNALRRNGQFVRLICTRLGGDPAPSYDWVDEVVELPVPSEIRDLQKSLRRLYQAQLRLPAEVRQCLINKDAMERLKALWSVDPPDAVLERLSLFGIAGLRCAAELRIPHFLEVNALLSEEAKEHRSLNDYETARTAEDEVLRHSRHLFCVSAELADLITGRGIERGKITVMPNGFDSRLFRPSSGAAIRKRLKLGNRFCFGTAGSLKPWHGIGTLLEAFRKVSVRRASNTSLLIIGEGPELETVAAFQRQHPGLDVHCSGAVPHSEVSKWLSACDALVAPYDPKESFYFSPMKVYEYMAVGKPVIASAQGQICSLIRHRSNGLLFEPGNVAELARRMMELYNKPTLCEELGKTGHDSVQPYTWLKNAERIVTELRKAEQ